jgi:hypothetical protein
MPELLLAFRRVTFLRRRLERCQRLLHFPLTWLHLSLSLSRTPSPSPFRSALPTTSSAVAIPGTLLRLSTSISPAFFSNELKLEYLYTGQGFGEAFEFLLNPQTAKLRQQSYVLTSFARTLSSCGVLAFIPMYASLSLATSSPGPLPHAQNSNNEPLTLTLPSPPFTPASLHFTLSFLHTDTLIFSHRSYDLVTAFHIMRAATYLSLYDEIQVRIVQEMLHGLFHAFLRFPEYERLTAGSWGTGGCRCRQCVRRIPRVLEFALADDVKNGLLERGARRALVGSSLACQLRLGRAF